MEAEASYLAYLAEALLGIGNVEDAHAVAEESVEVARRKETLFWELQSQIILANVLLQRNQAGDHPRIAECLKRAENLIDITGGKILLPLILKHRAELARLQGNNAENRRLLHEAYDLYRSMEAHGHAEWLEKKITSE